MNRWGVLGLLLVAISGPASLTDTAVGQQATLKGQLVGSWTFASSSVERPDGVKVNLFDANAKGIIVFADDGHFATVSTRPVAQVAFAYFGTFEVNELDRTIIRRYDRSLVPNGQQTEYKSFVNLAGDELKLIDQNPGEGRTEFVYRRSR